MDKLSALTLTDENLFAMPELINKFEAAYLTLQTNLWQTIIAELHARSFTFTEDTTVAEPELIKALHEHIKYQPRPKTFSLRIPLDDYPEVYLQVKMHDTIWVGVFIDENATYRPQFDQLHANLDLPPSKEVGDWVICEPVFPRFKYRTPTEATLRALKNSEQVKEIANSISDSIERYRNQLM